MSSSTCALSHPAVEPYCPCIHNTPPSALVRMHSAMNQKWAGGLVILCLWYSDSTHKPCCSEVYFSKHWPSGPMLFISRNVRLSVHLSVCLFVRLSMCSLLRYRLNVFLPPLPEVRCPILLETRNPWGKNGKKWSQIWTFQFESCLKLQRKKSLFFCWFCLTKHGENHASRWNWDLWLKGVSLILAYLFLFLSFCVLDDFFLFFKKIGFLVILGPPGNHASRWNRDLWSKGVSLILACF